MGPHSTFSQRSVSPREDHTTRVASRRALAPTAGVLLTAAWLAVALLAASPTAAAERSQSVFAADEGGARHDDDSETRNPPTIVWPSPRFPTLQSAIDAVAEGGALTIRPGSYEVQEPLLVIGKRIVIEGAGCGGGARGRATVLRGPRPTTVTEGSRAVGLITYRDGAGGVLEGLELSGFDATILIDDRSSPPREEGAGGTPGRVNDLCPPPQLKISRVCLRETGRGVLAYTSSRIEVVDSRIEDSLWNGISLVGLPDLALPQGYNIANLFLKNVKNIGVLIKDSTGVCDECHTLTNAGIGDCLGGGVVAVRSGICITQSFFAHNSLAAIAILQSAALIQDTHIVFTHSIEDPPGSGHLRFGDGILVSAIDFPSHATVLNSESNYNARAGVSNFGSKVSLGNSKLSCNAFDLEGEDLDGHQFELVDLGGNACGCPDPDGTCLLETVGIEPPEPVTPIE